MALIIVSANLAKQAEKAKNFLNLSNRMHHLVAKNCLPVAETMIKAMVVMSCHVKFILAKQYGLISKIGNSTCLIFVSPIYVETLT